MRHRVTVIIEEITDHDDPEVQKYVFPNVEGFEVTTWQDYHFYNDSMNFTFKGEAWGNKDGHYVTLERNR